MPLQLPNLDDRTYDDLVAEGLNLIPTHAPEWTNYNPSDPGITLIELFAHLTELLIYRLDRVTDANKIAFLKLINGPEWTLDKNLDQAIRETIQALRTSDRAITCDDFEQLALKANPQIARARCVPNINLASDSPITPTKRPGYISIVIVRGEVRGEGSLSGQQLIDQAKAYLDQRRLLTTRISVVEPHYLKIRVQVKLVLKPDAIAKDVEAAATQKLQFFFHPLKGGQQGNGWEFGRPIYISEIYELLDELSGVDYVERARDPANKELEEVITLETLDGDRRQLDYQMNKQGQLMAIALRSNELVDLQIAPGNLQFPEATPKTPRGLR